MSPGIWTTMSTEMVHKKHKKQLGARYQIFQPELLVFEAPEYYGKGQSPKRVWHDDSNDINVYRGDSLIFLDQIHRKYPQGTFDLIFADPPYFLSNDGITCHAGKMVSVNKGEWDKIKNVDQMHDFNRTWLSACQKALRPNGSIFISGTSHVIHSIGFAMQQLEFKLLNNITWVKPNPPPNLSCRYFTHATETILWAAKSKKSKHRFNYDLMREINGQKQMKSVWQDIRWDESEVQVLLEIMPPGRDEKIFGKHPTQKPLKLLERLIMAASVKNDLVFDPFLGSGTTAVAARNLGRRFVGCELDPNYVSIAIKRLKSGQRQQPIPFSSSA
ncbi:MAG: DNA methyltransferase [Candidatus Eisenbacteria bacterium]|nr:DNA methyltransferase [Candidatus Eisenbacteria bacterium]